MSIREVAARAGVSAATVSRVFTQPDAVAVDTRQRVMAVAEDMRYTPHPVARSLARGRTGNDRHRRTRHRERLLRCDHQGRAGGGAPRGLGAVRLGIRRAGRRRAAVGGGVGAPGRRPAARLAVDARRGAARVDATVPVVMINRLLDGIASVVVDAAEAVAHAVEHLHALGHRRIVYLAGPPVATPTSSACAATGKPARGSGWRPPNWGRSTPGSPRGSVPPTSSSRAAPRPCLAYNDEVAVGVINRLFDRGVRVPEDLSIVGVDDTSLAEMVTPRLTTVRLPADALGRAAAECCSTRSVARSGPVTARSARPARRTDHPFEHRPGDVDHERSRHPQRGRAGAAHVDHHEAAGSGLPRDHRHRARPQGLDHDGPA